MPLNPLVSEMFANMVAAGRPALSAGSPADGRALTRASRSGLGQGPEMASVRELRIPARSGDIAARLLVPHGDINGLVVYFHGGGWVIGELDDYDAMARTLAARSHCAVLMPDYRLAPEHPFPAGLEDAEAAILWASQHTAQLAGRAVPLVVAGDSAGGNLATVATCALHGAIAIAAQVLIYPVTNSDTATPSYLNFSDGMQLTARDMQWFFSHYAPADQHADPRISPLNHTPMAGLPTTVIVTAECDVLRDDGERYAERLAAAGVRVVARRASGLPHGFIRLHNLVPAADEALSAVAADIARICTATSPQ